MTLRWVLMLLLMVSTAIAAENEARIVKVLPHLLDSKGRNALAPSLFERDAYQAYLRQNEQEIAQLRFDVQYKTRSKAPLVLRMEIRGSKMAAGRSRVFETDLQPRRWISSWGALHLDRKTFSEIGNIVAWRASLWRDGAEIAAQESFLW